MKSIRTMLLFGLLLFTARPASAIPFGVHLYGVSDSEMNKTLDSFNGGNLNGFGISLGAELMDDWSLVGFYENIDQSNGDWDPTASQFVPYDVGNPVYDGNIKTTRDVSWSGLGIRYDFGEVTTSKGDNLFQFYVTGMLASVKNRLTMSDGEATISETNHDLGWGGGLGFEWAINSSSDTDRKLFGLSLEAGRRDYRAEYDDLGAGFGPRLSHSGYWRFGVAFYFGK